MSEFLRLYGPLLLTVIQLLLAWFLWSMRREFTTLKKCEEHRREIAASCTLNRDRLGLEVKQPTVKTAHDLEDLRRRVERLPERTEIDALAKEMRDMNKTLGSLDGRLTGIGRAVDLMNQHLINSGHGEK